MGMNSRQYKIIVKVKVQGTVGINLQTCILLTSSWHAWSLKFLARGRAWFDVIGFPPSLLLSPPPSLSLTSPLHTEIFVPSFHLSHTGWMVTLSQNHSHWRIKSAHPSPLACQATMFSRHSLPSYRCMSTQHIQPTPIKSCQSCCQHRRIWYQLKCCGQTTKVVVQHQPPSHKWQ